MRKKLGLFWFAAALLGAALIFAGCPTEAETETKYVSGEMIRLDVVVKNEAELAAALEVKGGLAIGLEDTATLSGALEIYTGEAVYILNGGKLVTNGEALTVAGIVYVGVGGELDASSGNVIVTSGGISVLSEKTVVGITGVGPGTLKVADADSVNDGASPKPETVLGTDKVRILGALEFGTALDDALINKAFTYVQPGGAVNVGTVSSVAAAVTVPTGKILNVAAELTIAAGAELVATGDVNVAATGSLVLTGAAGTDGATLTATGDLIAGATKITGTWQAVGTAGAVTIAATSGTTSSIAGTVGNAFTAGAGGLITQGAGAGNDLTIDANTEIALGGVFAASVGTIVLTGDNTNPAVLTLIGTITGETGLATGVAAGSIAITNAILGGSITGTTDAGTNSNLGSLIGSASANTITAGSVSKDVTLKSSTTIK